MTKRIVSVLLALLLALGIYPLSSLADGRPDQQPRGTYVDGEFYPAPRLDGIKHNCPNTGKMVPEVFDPDVTSYILTVASWVSRVQFTPYTADPDCVVRVNGIVVPHGSKSSYISMTDNPQQALITITNALGEVKTYTIFLQRRPSERRTRVSAGFINDIYFKSDKWYIDADLVTVKYGDGNRSKYENYKKEHYKYNVTDTCIYYYGNINNAVRARDLTEFMAHYNKSGMYRFIYIEDEIVAVLPYGPDNVTKK